MSNTARTTLIHICECRWGLCGEVAEQVAAQQPAHAQHRTDCHAAGNDYCSQRSCNEHLQNEGVVGGEVASIGRQVGQKEVVDEIDVECAPPDMHHGFCHATAAGKVCRTAHEDGEDDYHSCHSHHQQTQQPAQHVRHTLIDAGMIAQQQRGNKNNQRHSDDCRATKQTLNAGIVLAHEDSCDEKRQVKAHIAQGILLIPVDVEDFYQQRECHYRHYDEHYVVGLVALEEA